MSEPTPEFFDQEYWMGKDHKPTKSNYFDYEHGSVHVDDAKALHAIFPEATSALDVGCCFGYQVQELISLGVNAHGVDFSRYATDHAFDTERVKWADAGEHIPHPDGAFDLVFSFATFEHIPEHHIKRALEEVRRVLRPGGRFLVYPEVYGSDHVPLDPSDDQSHVTRMSLAWWKAMMAEVFPEGLDEDAAKRFVEASDSARRWKWTIFVTNPKAT